MSDWFGLGGGGCTSEEEDDGLSCCANDFVADLMEFAVEDFSDEVVHEVVPFADAAPVYPAAMDSDDEDEDIPAAKLVASASRVALDKEVCQPIAPMSPRFGRNPRRSKQEQQKMGAPAPPASPRDRKPSPRRALASAASEATLVPRPPAAAAVTPRPSRRSTANISQPAGPAPPEPATSVPAMVAASVLSPLRMSPRRSSSASCRPMASAMEMDLAGEGSMQYPAIDWSASLNKAGHVDGVEPSLWAKDVRPKAGFLPKLQDQATGPKIDWSMGMMSGTAMRRSARSVF